MQRPGLQVTALFLLLAFSLHPSLGNSGTDPAPAAKQPIATPANAPAQPAGSRAQPAPKASKSRLAMAADQSAPRPRGKTQRKLNGDELQRTLAQIATQREAEYLAGQKSDRIRELLDRAQRDYQEGRLIEPAKNNAAFRYNEVLALDPSQLEAISGARRIVAILVGEAEHAAIAGDRARAQQYIDQIKELQPQDPSLIELNARLQALSDSPVVLSSRQQFLYGLSSDSVDRGLDRLKNDPLNLRTIDRAIDDYDRAENWVSQAPGLPTLKDRIILSFPAATRAELARDNSLGALRVVELARERGWFVPELAALETQAKEEIQARKRAPSKLQQR